jgi:ketopantoate reductase
MANTTTPSKKTVLIIGAGPVGSLTALSLHKRGWKVEIWEGRTGQSYALLIDRPDYDVEPVNTTTKPSQILAKNRLILITFDRSTWLSQPEELLR